MKFPRLSDDALKSLEKEFVSFLVVQGFDDALWRDLNAKEPDKAQGLVDLFSQVVWEKIIDQTHYLIRNSNEEKCLVYVGEREGEMILLQRDEQDKTKHVLTRGRKTWQESRTAVVWDFFSQGFERTTQEEYIKVKKELIP